MVVGAVGKAHGLDGATHLVGYGGVVPIDRGTEVLIGDRPAVVVERKGTHDRPIVRFDIAATRDAIEALRGMDVTRGGRTRCPTPTRTSSSTSTCSAAGCAAAIGCSAASRAYTSTRPTTCWSWTAAR